MAQPAAHPVHGLGGGALRQDRRARRRGGCAAAGARRPRPRRARPHAEVPRRGGHGASPCTWRCRACASPSATARRRATLLAGRAPSGVPDVLSRARPLLRPRAASTAPPTGTTGTTASASSSSAARRLEAVARLGADDGGAPWRPQIVHANDWQTGPRAHLSPHALPRPSDAWRRLATRLHDPQPRLPGRVLALRHADDRARLGPLHARRPRVLRQAQLPQGRARVLRSAHHGQPHLRARDPHAARSAAGSRACSKSGATTCTASSTGSTTTRGIRRRTRPSPRRTPPRTRTARRPAARRLRARARARGAGRGR